VFQVRFIILHKSWQMVSQIF